MGRRADHFDVEICSTEGTHQPHPERQPHLQAACVAEAVELDDVAPAEALEQLPDLRTRRGVVAGHEDGGVAVTDRSRVDHHRCRHRVQRLDHLRLGEGALDLLGQRVGVLDAQRGWEAPLMSSGFDTSTSTLPARWSAPTRPSAARLRRAVRRVDHELGVRRHRLQGLQRRRRTPAHSSRSPRLLGVPGAHGDLVALLGEGCGQRAPDDAAADHCDPHASETRRPPRVAE